MRQAAWEELFKAAETREEEEKRPWWHRFSFISWEDVVTLGIVMFLLVTIIGALGASLASGSILTWSNYRGVINVSSLLPLSLVGVLLALALARSGIHEVFAHLIGVAVGVAGVVYTATGMVSGSFTFRISELYERMSLWVTALTTGGISNDPLPFAVMVIALTYVTAYFSAWSIFRWYNAWLGLIPGGLALMTIISYQPGQSSFSMLLFLFGAILLVARVHVLRNIRDWRERLTGYPDLLSIYVLHVTVWVALGLLAVAWVLPVGQPGGVIVSAWERATSPLAGPLSDLGRVFGSIEGGRGGGSVHQFGSTMPLRGPVNLGSSEVMRVVVSETGFLRAQTYDEYTPQGWKLSPDVQITSSVWPALRPMQNPDEVRRQFRRPVSVQVTTSKRAGVIVSNGLPLSASIDARIVFGPDITDITSLRPTSRLDAGSDYRVESTLSSATPTRLRNAGTNYPAWIEPYLQLPDNYSTRVQSKAREVAANASNPYDIAVQIENFLRTNYSIDTDIPPPPHNRDAVEYFLFNLNRGYFDYHASAMAVMLRSLGIPARVAVGYVVRPQDRMPDSNTYVILEANAFAWPEVYFPGLGWVEFNPTPSEPRVNRPGSDDGFFDEDDFDPFADEDFMAADFFPDAGPPMEELDLLAGDSRSNLIGNIILAVIVLFLGVTLISGGVFHFSWQHGLGGLDYATQTWEKTVRLARWARIPSFPQQTPAEYASQLQDELPEVPELRFISDSFVKARYGRKELSESEKERLTEAWKAVRNTLLGRILRWK
jgi:transglutaminase-like putative cysteine protease